MILSAGPPSAKLARVDIDNRAIREELVVLMHAFSLATQKLGATFAQRHGLHPTDLQALIAVMQAERHADPLTPGRLAEEVGLSSGAATAVVDRLERAGHLRRTRESSDGRVVHLRRGEPGAALASSFFGPLAERSNAALDEFSAAELATVRRFLRGATDVVGAYHQTVRRSG